MNSDNVGALQIVYISAALLTILKAVIVNAGACYCILENHDILLNSNTDDTHVQADT